ncbi:hypothetical protein V8G54_016790 [Vigna mungo]|uniref:Uncharacterized protein n=1 Tax=Vigna mungo TaxID=3915 RepID=A0AAQ3NM42_VIGMU
MLRHHLAGPLRGTHKKKRVLLTTIVTPRHKVPKPPPLGRCGCLLAGRGPHTVRSFSHAFEIVAAVHRLSLLQHQRLQRQTRTTCGLKGKGRNGRVRRRRVMVEGWVERSDLAVAENVVGGGR